MYVLRLSDVGTRQVLKQYDLKAEHRLGRGKFCAVYEAGPNAVNKLTADNIQLESIRDFMTGEHFPTLLSTEGYVGDQYQLDASLYLFQTEKLRPVREGSTATRKLARKILATVDNFWGSSRSVNHAYSKPNVSLATKLSMRAEASIEQLAQCTEFPESIRTAFEKIRTMMENYENLTIDFHSGNLMVRGTDELIFNDVIVDSVKLTKH